MDSETRRMTRRMNLRRLLVVCLLVLLGLVATFLMVVILV